MTTKKMSLAEFRTSGLLQEVNRLFFHPRGLAIGIRITTAEDVEFDGIRDHRDDPKGLVFADLTSDEARDKAVHVAGMASDKAEARLGLLGEAVLRHVPGGLWSSPSARSYSRMPDMTTNQLPLAPDGFAWMLCLKAAIVAGDALLIDGRWHIDQGHTQHKEASRAACLMRRLGPTEKPWRGCQGLDFGEWCPTNEHPKSMSLEWYAPVRFPRYQAPNFGSSGWRYLDDGEVVPSLDDGLAVAEIGGKECVPVTLPPLPESDLWARDARRHKDGSHCTAASPAECGRAHLQRPTRPAPATQGIKDTEADAFEAARDTYDEILADASDAPKLRAEIAELRAELAKVATAKEVVKAALERLQKRWWATRKALGAHGQSDTATYAAYVVKQLAKVTAERDALATAAADLEHIRREAQDLMSAKVRGREEMHVLLEAIANGDI